MKEVFRFGDGRHVETAVTFTLPATVAPAVAEGRVGLNLEDQDSSKATQNDEGWQLLRIKSFNQQLENHQATTTEFSFLNLIDIM